MPPGERRTAEHRAICMVLPDRIELSTSPLPRECSTTELRQHGAASARPKRAETATRGGSAQGKSRGPTGPDWPATRGGLAPPRWPPLVARARAWRPGRSCFRDPAATPSPLADGGVGKGPPAALHLSGRLKPQHPLRESSQQAGGRRGWPPPGIEAETQSQGLDSYFARGCSSCAEESPARGRRGGPGGGRRPLSCCRCRGAAPHPCPLQAGRDFACGACLIPPVLPKSLA
jgi:hypothetical protein